MTPGIEERARDLSRLLEPPRWRFLKHRHWRRHQQPEHVLDAYLAAFRGEHEPLRRVGRRA